MKIKTFARQNLKKELETSKNDLLTTEEARQKLRNDLDALEQARKELAMELGKTQQDRKKLGKDLEQWVKAKPLVVVEVLIAKRQGVHPLSQQRPQFMLHPPRVPAVFKAGGQAGDEIHAPLVTRPLKLYHFLS